MSSSGVVSPLGAKSKAPERKSPSRRAHSVSLGRGSLGGPIPFAVQMSLIRFFKRGVAGVLLTLTAFAPSASWAWGAQGHRITGLVADAFLTARARIAVHDLLGGESLSDASTWMDQEKRHLGPAKAQWHYTNQAVCGAPAVRCPKGNCLTSRLPSLLEEVGDLRLSHAQRATALRMVIHLVGDLHQRKRPANPS